MKVITYRPAGMYKEGDIIFPFPFRTIPAFCYPHIREAIVIRKIDKNTVRVRYLSKWKPKRWFQIKSIPIIWILSKL